MKPNADLPKATEDSKPKAPESKPVPSDLTPRIAERAYQLYEEEGHHDGHAPADWEKAEREIRQPVSRKWTDANRAPCIALRGRWVCGGARGRGLRRRPARPAAGRGGGHHEKCSRTHLSFRVGKGRN
jgi:hypothetical protein